MVAVSAHASTPPAPTPIRGPLRVIRIVCFSVVSFFWTAFCFVVGCFCLLFTPRSGKLGSFTAQLWGQVFIRSLGIEIKVHGKEKIDRNTPRMFVANHASWFDPPAIFLSIPTHVRFVLKRELIRLPFIGWYTALAGHFLIDRTNPRKGQQTILKAVERIKRYNLSPAVFPEGTRTRDGTLGPFRTGAFALAIRAGIDIQPVFIEGSYEIWPRHLNIPERAGVMHVTIGDPISIAGHKGSAGRKRLSALVRTALIDMGARDSTHDPSNGSANSN